MNVGANIGFSMFCFPQKNDFKCFLMVLLTIDRLIFIFNMFYKLLKY
jgi:hypothetical protein